MKYLILVIIAMGILSVETSAQDKTPVINKREVKQNQRIKEGVKTGQLTKGEAKYLHKEQKEIRSSKRSAKSDGKVSKGERKMIRSEQNQANKDIYKLKHNKKVVN
jgi:hypothetical protein